MPLPPLRNAVLRQLPPEELAALAPRLEAVALAARQTLALRGLPVEHVHFIDEGLVSVVVEPGEGEAVEACQIGRDGVVGIQALYGAPTAAFRRVVLIPGRAHRMGCAELRAAKDRLPVLGGLLARSLDAAIVQAAQNAGCASLHPLRQRLAAWLLATQARSGTVDLPLTHAQISRLIGARRASVTTLLGGFEATGALAQRRGRLEIRDAALLEAAACSCRRAPRDAPEPREAAHAHAARIARPLPPASTPPPVVE